MNARPIAVGILLALCAGAAWGVLVQHRQLTNLRADYRQLLGRLSESSDTQPASTTAQQPAAAPADATATSPPLELLQLRNQVSRLTARKSELANVSAENDRLKAQLAGRSTNTFAGIPLPADYIRKSQARWVGFNTPENTMQSFLWALQNGDLTNMIQALTPKSAAEMMEHVGKSPEEFFEQTSMLPGMRVVDPHQLPDGSIEAQMEIVPGETLPLRVHFFLIDGQWRLDMP